MAKNFAPNSKPGVFRVALFNILHGILKRPTLVAKVTKIWEC